jgi:Carboxypeptidase regulatory-like domain/TonB-dependent Receptor Plug Domain
VKHFSSFSFVAALCVFALLFAAPATWGQAATGRVFGTVTDQQHAAVPQAKVTVTNEATQVPKRTTTNDEGYFEVLDLPIGSYTVTVEHEGFTKYVTMGNKLLINESLKFEITLKIGAPSQTVTVEAQASQVETTNPTLGQSVTSRPIVDLPLNGRNVLDLATLQPGVTIKNADDTGAGNFSVAGGRPDSVTYLLDGGLNNNLLSNGVVLNPNPDAVAEFKILTSDYTAEYGRNGAGVVSVVIKSGTNSLHGSAFEFARNTDFNANSYFNIIDGLPRNDLKRHQFGGALGGPITIPHILSGKDRLFFFFDYQGQRLTQSAVQSQVTTFTPAELQGDFSQAVPNGSSVTLFSDGSTFTCTSSPACPDPNVAAFLQANPFFASPNGNAAQAIIDPTQINSVSAAYIKLGLIPTSSTGLISTASVGNNNNNEITGKVDYIISAKDKLTVTIGGFRNSALSPFVHADVPGFPNINGDHNYFGNIAYTRTFSSNLVNEFRFTAQRNNHLQEVPAATLPTPASLGFGITPDKPTGPPAIDFDSGLTLGFSVQGPTSEINNTYAYTDTVTWVKGHNTWKFGGGFSAYQNNTLYDFYGNGDFFFQGGASIAAGGSAAGTGNSFADFLLGIPNNLFQGPDAPSNIRTKFTYGFFQDEWRARSNLTLTLGLRYEYAQPKLDTQGRTFSIIPGLQSTRFVNAPQGLVFPGDKGVPRGSNFPDKDNFGPRFGLAWDPWNNGKTSIRGGVGVFYDILKGEDNLQFNGQPPFFADVGTFYNSVGPGQASEIPYLAQPWTASAGGFSSNPFPSKPPSSNLDFTTSGFIPFDFGGGIFFVDPHIHTPYTYQYNLSVQHELAKSLVAEVNYVGSSSKGLTTLVDINPFVLTTANRLLNLPYNSGPLASSEIGTFCAGSIDDCPFAAEPEFENTGFANYNSLEASLTRHLDSSRYFGTTFFTLAYTYGHSIDNSSGFRNRSSQVPYYNINQFRGSSDFDASHRLTFSGGWDLPFDRAWSSGPSRLVKGWSLYPILSWQTGFPLSISDQFSFNPALPGPSGAGDGYLASAVFASGVTQLQTFDPKSNPSSLSGQCSSVRCAWFFNPNDLTFIPAGGTGYGLPRNFFRGPGLTNLDISLVKSTQIFENLKAELRLDAFNVFNHAEFANPDTNIFDNTFGQITQTANEARAINPEDQVGGPRILQVALKLTF